MRSYRRMGKPIQLAALAACALMMIAGCGGGDDSPPPDTTAPLPSTVTTAPTGSTNDNTPTLSGTAEPNATISVMDGATSVGTTTADSTGNWSVTTSVLADGTYTLDVIASDAAGNASTATSVGPFTVDTAAPTAASISTAPTGSTNDNTSTLSGTAEPNATITVMDGATSVGTTTADSTGNWSVTTSVLADGTYTLDVIASDAAGNASTATSVGPFTVDTAAPTAASISTAPTGSTNDNTLILSGTAEPNATIAVMDGATSVGTTTADSTGSWSVTTSVLADGTYTLGIIASDAAGNASTSTSIGPFTVDTAAPAAPTISTALTGPTIDNTPTLSGTAEPNATIAVMDGATSVGTTTADSTGNWSVTTSVLAPGTYTLGVIASDAAGNTSTSTSVGPFTVIAPPTVTSVNPNSGASAGGTDVTVTGTAFQSGATVSFGGVAATSVTFVSATEITCTTPTHAIGAVDVVVTNPDTQTGTLTSGFSYLTTWTIFVYGHADHNLSISLIRDIQEMNNATLGDHVRVVVMADFSSGRTNPDTGLPFPSGTEWYIINGGGQAETLIGTDSEYNFDDPLVLQAGVEVVVTSFPADRYGIVMWDHGGSWDRGFGGDEQDILGGPTGGGMLAAEVATAITNGLTAAGITGVRPLEFVAFDTCLLMGNEVAYDFRNLAKTYIACAEIDFGDGWDYQATFTYISANPAASATVIAIQEVAQWDAHHATASVSDFTVRAHAALDLTQMDAFATAWYDLAATMTLSSSLDWLEVGRKQFVSTPGYSFKLEDPTDYPNIRDAGQFLDELVTVTSDANVPVDAATARTALDALVLATSLGDLRSAQGQSGVFCELPLARNWTTARRTAYLGLSWNAWTRWSDVLDALESYSDAVAPVVITSVINTADPDAANLPEVTLRSDDLDVAEAQVLMAETIAGNVYLYGLIGEGLVDPGTDYVFTWDGNLFVLDDGAGGLSEIYLGRWISAGANSIYVIPGTLSDGAETLTAYAVYEDGNPTVSEFFVDFQGQIAAVPMSDAKGGVFTPVLYNETTGSWVLVTPLTIPNTATPSLTFSAGAAAPGTYHIITTMTDVWGNTGAFVDDVTVITPFGD